MSDWDDEIRRQEIERQERQREASNEANRQADLARQQAAADAIRDQQAWWGPGGFYARCDQDDERVRMLSEEDRRIFLEAERRRQEQAAEFARLEATQLSANQLFAGGEVPPGGDSPPGDEPPPQDPRRGPDDILRALGEFIERRQQSEVQDQRIHGDMVTGSDLGHAYLPPPPDLSARLETPSAAREDLVSRISDLSSGPRPPEAQEARDERPTPEPSGADPVADLSREYASAQDRVKEWEYWNAPVTGFWARLARAIVEEEEVRERRRREDMALDDDKEAQKRQDAEAAARQKYHDIRTEFGMPVPTVDYLVRASKALGLEFYFRKTNADALDHLDRGAELKAKIFELKSVDEDDVYLAARKEHRGLVAIWQLPRVREVLERLDAKGASQAVRARVLDRYADRVQQFEKARRDLEPFLRDGILSVGEGGVILGPNGRPFASDHDLYDIRRRDGGALSWEKYEEVVNFLQMAGIVAHGAHARWIPENDDDRARKARIDARLSPGIEQEELLQIGSQGPRGVKMQERATGYTRPPPDRT